MEKILIGLIRGATLFTRSVMVVIFAALLDSDSFGEFSLITTVVSYGLLVLGLDLYTFTTRQAAVAERRRLIGLIQGHFIILGIPYLLLFFPVMFFMEKIGIKTNLFLIFAILLFDHLNQEGYRLLIALGLVKTAGISLFIRSASWVWLVIPILWSHQLPNKLSFLLNCWLYSSVVSLLLIFKIFVSKYGIYFYGKYIPWNDFKNSTLTVSKYWISTIAFRLTNAGDRFILALIGGVGVVGSYSLSFSIAAIWSALYEPIRLESQFSKFAKNLSNGLSNGIKNDFQKEIKISWCVGFAVFVILLALFQIIQEINFGNKNFLIAFPLRISAAVYGGAAIPHITSNYCLYLNKKDTEIFKVNISGFLIFILVMLIIFLFKLVDLVAIAPTLTMLYLAIHKTYLVQKKMLANQSSICK